MEIELSWQFAKGSWQGAQGGGRRAQSKIKTVGVRGQMIN